VHPNALVTSKEILASNQKFYFVCCSTKKTLKRKKIQLNTSSDNLSFIANIQFSFQGIVLLLQTITVFYLPSLENLENIYRKFIF